MENQKKTVSNFENRFMKCQENLLIFYNGFVEKQKELNELIKEMYMYSGTEKDEMHKIVKKMMDNPSLKEIFKKYK